MRKYKMGICSVSNGCGHFNLGFYDALEDGCMMWSQDVGAGGPEGMITEWLNRKHSSLC
jgi:hypothetical protein